jgi:hypothetical protein
MTKDLLLPVVIPIAIAGSVYILREGCAIYERKRAAIENKTTGQARCLSGFVLHPSIEPEHFRTDLRIVGYKILLASQASLRSWYN